MNTIDYTINARKINIKEYLSETKEKSIIIYSNTSIEKNNIKIENKNIELISTNKITKNKEKIDNYFKNFDYKKIISIGGGTALDIGKYLSSKYKIDMIAVPTMLSTNAYSTNKVALIINDKVTSIDAVSPKEVYFDKELLLNSQENNLYGLVDIFSISTALNDWKLAIKYNKEKKSKEYFEAKKLLANTIDYVSTHDKKNIGSDIEFIFKIIGESGLITNRYGSGKPESGSEHIFAKAVEKEISIPHAVSVTNGIILMILAQNMIYNYRNKNKDIIAILKELGMFELNKKYRITYSLIEKIFMNLKPRNDRFSVVDIIYENKDIKIKILENYKEIMEGWLD